MEGPVTTPLTASVIKDLVDEAKDFAYCNGLVLRTARDASSQDEVTHAPFTLFPSPVPKLCFQNAVSVQRDFNLLMHRIAHDYEFLKDCLQSVIKVDDFTRRLWHIYETVIKEGVAQPICLGMNRSDYMFDTGMVSDAHEMLDYSKIKLRQIEFNTMSSSFGGLSFQLQELHKFSLIKAGLQKKYKHIPENESVKSLALAVITAWEAYNNQNSVIVFLVLPTERNIYDQRLLEYSIQRCNPNAKLVRKTLRDFRERAVLTSDKCLMIDDMEVAIVYQRCCYAPDHFDGEEDWEARLLIERSKAIKCPSINYHLAGTKKIQQVLAKPGVIDKYLPHQAAADNIRATFAGQYSLDLNSEGDENSKMGMSNPDLFVLKPQREGGGNNIFGLDIKDKLEKLEKSDERTAYILMERIHPMKHNNYPIRSGNEVQLLEMVSELGIFGALVGTQDKIILNEDSGYILRSKTAGTDEGGVATGFSVLDLPYLV